MKNRIINNITIITSLIMLVFATACNSKPNDKEILENVTKQLQSDKDFTGVSASVKDGVVTLSGTCKGENCPDRATDKVKDVAGVKNVESAVMRDASIDVTMRTSVQDIVSRYPGVQADVTSGVIVLRGTIDKDNLQSLMSGLSALHPDKIDNQLVVK